MGAVERERNHMKNPIRIAGHILLLVSFFLLLNGCGNGNGTSAIGVALTQSGSATTVNAGGGAVTLTAAVTNDTANGGVTWSLSPATGCGTLATSGATATYTPPAESSLNANCTATITSTSVTNGAKSSSLALTIDAVALTLPSGESKTYTQTAGASSTVQLSASIADDASGAAVVDWSISGAATPAIRRLQRVALSPRATPSSTCGSLSGSSGASVTYTPPATGPCTATITASVSANSNVTQTFTVSVDGQATASVTAANKTYDGTTSATVSSCTLAGIATADAGNVSCSAAAASFASAGVGTGKTVTATGITLSGSAAGNYVLTSTSAATTANIGKAAASVTPTAASKVYGASDPSLTGTLTGFVASDGVSAAYSRTTGETVAGGPYTISATLSPAGVLGNYNITYNTASFTINKASASVSPAAASKTYGGTDPSLSGTLAGFVAGDGVTATYSRTAGETVAGSPYTISATLSPANVLGNYNVTYNTAGFTVTKANASVTPAAASKVYGGTDPSLSGTLTGFLASDGVTATYSRTAGETVAGSPYTISATLSPANVLGNYNITYNTAGFAVTKANASVTPAAASKTYGGTDPSLSGTLTGFLASDSVAATYSRTAGETVAGSPYTISATLSPANVLGNYNITSNTAAFTITKANASVTPNAASKAYGTGDPSFSGTLAGFLSSDGITATYTRTAGETVANSPYTISATLNPTAALANYNITYNTANFAISQASASVTPNAASKVYGTTDPSFSGTLAGFLSSDGITATYTRTAGETVANSPYAISATLSPTAVLANYNITYKTANFSISQAPASVTPNAASKAYGASDPNPLTTGTLIGFLASDNVTATYSRTPGETVAGSPYTISATLNPPAAVANYNVTYNTASFYITAVPAHITVVSGSSSQSAAVGTAFASSLAVQVTDASSNPISGVAVTFSAPPNSGPTATLSGYSMLTGPTGQASVTATANTIAGSSSYNVTAAVNGLLPVTFGALTNTPGPPVSIAVSGGSGQNTTVGAAFTNPLVVTVTDAYSNVISGKTVTFSAPSTGASATFTGNPASTNSSGQASVTATANTTAGSYNATASINGVSTPVTFSLTNQAGPAYAIQTVAGSTPQSTNISTAFANPLAVTVTDAYGNGISGATVTFAAPNSGASATFTGSNPATTNSSGQASVAATANSTVGGPYSVTASVGGTSLTPATFSLTNQATSFNISGFVQSGYNGGLDGVTITLTPQGNGTPLMTTTAYASSGCGGPGNDGCYSFANVPKGSYTITPSMTGANATFSPASIQVTVSSSDLTNESFQATVGYTVSGTVTYPANDKQGTIYINLLSSENTCNGGACYGTAIPYSVYQQSGGGFTINGVPAGTYKLQAWMDDVGLGVLNGSDPAGAILSVIVGPNATPPNPINQDVTLYDVSIAWTATDGPKINMIAPIANGVVLQIGPATYGTPAVEVAPRYHVQWSTTSDFSTIAGEAGGTTTQLPATGGDQPYILTSENSALTGLTGSLYFRIRGENGSANKCTGWTVLGCSPTTASACSNSSASCTTPQALTIAAADPGSNVATVNGYVTYSGAATGPLYVGCYDQNSGNMYGQSIAHPTFTGSGQYYSVVVGNTADCFMFTVLDNNNNGVIDVGDASDMGGNNNGNTLQIVGSNIYPFNIALAGSNNVSSMTTSHSQTNGANDSYGLNFDVESGLKLPVAVELVSGPNLLAPMDFAPSEATEKGGRFQFWPNLINGATRPATGGSPDTYVFSVWYSDGSNDPAVSIPVTTVLDSFARNLAVDTTDSPATPETPTFTWQAPAAPPAGGYTYEFWISLQNGGSNVWQVPGNNSKSNGLSSSILDLLWGTDPTDSNNTPSPATLTDSTAYQWSVTVQDSSGNSAEEQTTYTPQ
jgi:hypothetical protein